MNCKWGCGKPGIFECTSFYGRKEGLTKCSKVWQECPAKATVKNKAREKQKETLSKKDFSEQMKKRAETLAQIDENGVSGFTRNALAVAASKRQLDGTWSGAVKMVQTKRKTKNEFDKDVYQLTAEKTAATRFGEYRGLKDKPEFQIYRYYVNRFTKQQPLHLLENYNKRAGYGITENPYQVDHKFSVAMGFTRNIPPYIIAHISNLEMLPAKQNNSKGANCSITEEELFKNFFGDSFNAQIAK